MLCPHEQAGRKVEPMRTREEEGSAS